MAGIRSIADGKSRGQQVAHKYFTHSLMDECNERTNLNHFKYYFFRYLHFKTMFSFFKTFKKVKIQYLIADEVI